MRRRTRVEMRGMDSGRCMHPRARLHTAVCITAFLPNKTFSAVEVSPGICIYTA